MRELLTDKEVIRSKLPQGIHNLFFSWVAKRRARKVFSEYQSMGGKSPIYEYTENFARILREKLQGQVIVFHRYLPATHKQFIKEISQINDKEMIVFPLFPQFTYSTTGSVAKWMLDHIPLQVSNKLRWIKSYATDPSFINAHRSNIQSFMRENQLNDQETIFLFSAHGLPKKYVDEGDIYQRECEDSFQRIMSFFPKILGRLCYQSRFGRQEWIQPYTIDLCHSVKNWHQGRSHIVFIPISFTSDHLETLCEVEKEYVSEIRKQELFAYRMPALNLSSDWIDASLKIIQECPNFSSTQMLVRHLA